jgi:flagellar basal body-associated protein FliL
MVRPDPIRNGTTETEERVKGADNSKDTLVMLVGGLVLALIAMAVLFWFFGIFPFHHAPTATTG